MNMKGLNVLDEAVEKLKVIGYDNYDIETNHGKADDILCDLLVVLGCKAAVDEFNNIDKWYA